MVVFQLIGELDHHERVFRASSNLLCHDSISVLMGNQTSRIGILCATHVRYDDHVLFAFRDDRDISESFMKC